MLLEKDPDPNPGEMIKIRNILKEHEFVDVKVFFYWQTKIRNCFYLDFLLNHETIGAHAWIYIQDKFQRGYADLFNILYRIYFGVT